MTGAPRGHRGEAGQSSVELVALLPLTLIIGLAILTLLAARSASGQAGAAAQAGAMALIQDGDVAEAANRALPPGVRGRADVRVDARRVTVTVHPRPDLPFLGDLLAATATADTGPAPR